MEGRAPFRPVLRGPATVHPLLYPTISAIADRTLRRDIPQNEITIGVAAYRDEKELTLGQLLVLPFRKQREWRLPNGLEPDRQPRPGDQLAE